MQGSLLLSGATALVAPARHAVPAPPMMSQPDASARFHRPVAHTQREAETYAPAFAPPLGALPVTPLSAAPRTAARQWVDGGTWHLCEWQKITRRAEDLRAECREVVLRCLGRGQVQLRYTTTPPERWRDAEGAECGGEAVEASVAHLTAERVGGA